ncbi:MAG TPA: hypothetical protein VG796_14150 [Verrucomicrobiales bacterium]|nr:hypothetical protein [Verrucomicrobiales bacterium]
MYLLPPNLRERELPPWIRDLLSSPPTAGCGLHQWIFRAVCALKPWRTDTDIFVIVSAATVRCGRNASREIAESIRNARSHWQPGISPLLLPPRRPAWPPRNLTAIATIARQGGLADLWEQSPWTLTSDRPDADEFIDHLFPGNPHLCAGICPQDALTLVRQLVKILARNPRGAQLISGVAALPEVDFAG